MKRHGFTLLELLAVMSIMGIMMFLAVAAIPGWRRGAAMRTSIVGLNTGLTQARQWAVTRRVRTKLEYGNDAFSNGYYVVRQVDGDTVGNSNLLARGIKFDFESGSVTSEVIFNVDGTCDWSAPSTEYGFYSEKDIVLVEDRGGGLRMWSTTTVYRLTGHIRTGIRD